MIKISGDHGAILMLIRVETTIHCRAVMNDEADASVVGDGRSTTR